MPSKDVFVKLADHLTAGQVLNEISMKKASELATVRSILDGKDKNKITDVGLVAIGNNRRPEGVRTDILRVTVNSDGPSVPYLVRLVPGFVKQAAAPEML